MNATIWPRELSLPLSDAERALIAPPELLTVSEWAARHRRIVSKDAAEPGPWSHERAPYLVEIMDALGDPDIDEVVFQKAARVGGTEALRNWLCWGTDQDPAPALLVYPTEDDARKQLQKEITPLLEQQPQMRQYLTGRPRDLKADVVELTCRNIYIGWSNSPRTLAQITVRDLLADEVDKWPRFSGAEAAPLDLARARTTTFGRRKKHAIISTPTTTLGAICLAWESCAERRHYYVPCPHCGTAQVLTQARLRWPKPPGLSREQLSAHVEEHQNAWYECEHCDGRLTETDKHRMVQAGEWVDEVSGRTGPPRSRRVGYQISALYSLLGITWSDMAAAWLRAQGSAERLMEYVNQKLGEPFREQTASVKGDRLRAKAARGFPRCVVPRWAGLVLCTADTQADGWYYVTRAWGRGDRSRRIDWGRVSTQEELLAATLNARFEIEGRTETMTPALLVVDAGGGADTGTDATTTELVHRMALADPRIRAVKGEGGESRPAQVIRTRRITYRPPGGKSNPFETVLHLLDTQYLADVLAARIAQEPNEDGAEIWELCEDGDGDPAYHEHMRGMNKVIVRRGQKVIEMWQATSHGRRVDYWDGEVYQVAAAKMARCELLPDEDELERQRDLRRQERRDRAHSDTDPSAGWATTPDGRPFHVHMRGGGRR